MPETINRRVLITDDERDLTDALAMRLKSQGFTVAVAYDGAEGLRVAETFKPDVVLLDLSMPVVDGWEMCRRLRADSRTRDIPLIVMTAWSPKELHERALAQGATEVLLKPIDEETLATILLRN